MSAGPTKARVGSDEPHWFSPSPEGQESKSRFCRVSFLLRALTGFAASPVSSHGLPSEGAGEERWLRLRPPESPAPVTSLQAWGPETATLVGRAFNLGFRGVQTSSSRGSLVS